jgi:hypothetical protein
MSNRKRTRSGDTFFIVMIAVEVEMLNDVCRGKNIVGAVLSLP